MMNRSVMERQMFRNGGPVRRMQQGGDPMMAPPAMPPAMPPQAPSMAGMPAPSDMPMDQAAQAAMQQGLDPAVIEGMLQNAAGQFESLDSAQNYEQVMNAIRGDEASVQERRQELAGMVGDADAAQTPESVLTLVQPVMQMAAVDQGIGSMAPEVMNTPVEGPMAGGIMSTINMQEPHPTPGQGGPAPVNFNRGGPVVAYMQEGGQPPVGGRQGEIFREQQALYRSLLDPEEQAQSLQEQKDLTQAQMLFDIAQGGLSFAAGAGKPGGTAAEQLAAAFVQPLGNISARAGEFSKFKQAQKKEGRAMDLAALQASGGLYATERAQQLKAQTEPIGKLFNVYDASGKLLKGGVALNQGSYDTLLKNNPGAILREIAVAKDSKPTALSPGAILVDDSGKVIARNPKAADDKTYTLSPGQVVVNARGAVIAAAPEKPQRFTLSPGERVVDGATGTTITSYEEDKTYTLGRGQQVIDSSGKVIAENTSNNDMTVYNVGGSLVGVDPKTKQTTTLHQGDTSQAMNIDGQVVIVDPTSKTATPIGDFKARKPEYRILRDMRNGLTTYVDISTSEGAARVAEANAANQTAGTTVFTVGNVPADTTPQAKAYRIENVGVRLSYDGGRTYVTEGKNGPQISTMPPDAQPLSDTIAADMAGKQRVQLLAGNQLEKMDAELGVALKTGSRDNPEALSNQELGLVRDAMSAARAGTGPYAGLAVFMDRTLSGAIPAARKAFQDEQANRQFLRALMILGRSALVVNPRFPVAEMERVGALFPDPEAFFTNPETEANKLVELKNLALAQRRANLQQLSRGIQDDATQQAVLSNNFEIERLLSLLDAVPTGPVGNKLDPAAVDALRSTIRSGRKPQ